MRFMAVGAGRLHRERGTTYPQRSVGCFDCESEPNRGLGGPSPEPRWCMSTYDMAGRASVCPLPNVTFQWLGCFTRF